MASKPQIEANRRNAMRSTGPKSLKGRLVASRNARRHGLSMPMEMTAQTKQTLLDLRELLAEDNKGREEPDILERVAISHLDIRRVRAARYAAILGLLASNEMKQCSVLQSFHRYERAALTSRRKGLSAYFQNSLTS